MKTYCLGYSHQKCDSCQLVDNWRTLNQMPNSLRLALQNDMRCVDQDACRLTNMGEHKPIGVMPREGW